MYSYDGSLKVCYACLLKGPGKAADMVKGHYQLYWQYIPLITKPITMKLVDAFFAIRNDVMCHGVLHADEPVAVPTLRCVDGEALPIDIESLRSFSSQAACGRGLDTVVDRDVRDVLEIDIEAAKVTVDWPSLDAVVAEVGTKLYPGHQLRAELHDVLLYEPGCHFNVHRDAKKKEGHQLTLSVTIAVSDDLACETSNSTKLEDGAFVDFMEADGDELRTTWNCGVAGAWAAWFCPEYHRVRAVARGWRLAATYNVIDSGERIPRPLPSVVTTPQNRNSFFLQLPADCAGYIAGFCTLKDRCHFAQCSRFMKGCVFPRSWRDLSLFLRRIGLRS